MSDMLHLDLVTPEKRYLSQDVHMVVVPSEMGAIGIMADHAPIISMLRPGMLEVYSDATQVTRYFVNGGYANVAQNNCTILAESLIPESELLQDEARESISRLKQELVQSQSDLARAALERRLMEEETKLLLAS